MKDIIVSYDDIFLNHDRLSDFEKVKKEIPDFKVTFFVIMYDFNTIEYINSLKKDWIELVYHANEHRGDWLKWTKEEAKENILKCQEYDFIKGFKAPGWKLTRPIVEALNELDYWACICGTEPILKEIKPKRGWITKNLGFSEYGEYSELYGHIQEDKFEVPLKQMINFYKNKGGNFKFISEMINIL
jgi:hypothetical protein